MNYIREFIEITQDQQGYNLQGEEVKGTCKFEVLDDKIKVKVKIKNLKKLKDGLKYSVHMIKASDNKSISVQLGELEVDKFGRANLNYSSSSNNSKESDILKGFNVVAIIIKDEKGFNNLKTPAIGYRKDKTLWRNNFTILNDKNELKKFHVDLNKIEDKQDEKNTDHIVIEKEEEPAREENKYTAETEQTEETVETFNGIPINELEQRDDYEVVKDQDGNTVMVKRYIDIDKTHIHHHKTIEEEKKENIETDNDNELNLESSKNIEEVKEDSTNENQENGKLNRFSRRANEMFNTYPKLYPFKNASQQEMWIRIEPRDIVIFPINTWQMMNNPFLLTGYYKHHHLLLGEKVKETGERYYLLAVPSQYNSRQKRIANIHGFEYFRSCRDIQPRTGEFGYWIKEINL